MSFIFFNPKKTQKSTLSWLILYLECGILAYGFLRLRCKDCSKEKLVAFSCKKRGICPSCGGRRMSETSSYLVNNIIPKVKVRQWVLSVPFSLRYWLSSNPNLQSSLLRIILRVISGFYKKRIKLDYKVSNSKTGAVTLIQRFGSSINLNVHYHILFLDGVYYEERFYGLRSLSNTEVADVLTKISKRVIRYLRKKGYLKDYIEVSDYVDEFYKSNAILSSCVRASISNRISLGARRGASVRRIGKGFGTVEEVASYKSSRCYSLNGFSLHSDRMVSAYARKSLESLCTYITRPAISEERLSWTVDGNISYKLKNTYSDGTTHVLFSPMVEIFDDRVEISNPGKPLIDTSRFIDHSPKSRNEKLAAFMRRINICEERGSGIDKVIFAIEAFQLPAPSFKEENDYIKVILFSPRALKDMDKADRIRATYQHSCIKYISNEFMTNQSLRTRFNVEDKNYPMISRFIKDSIDAGFIKPFDKNAGSKAVKYVPFWV